MCMHHMAGAAYALHVETRGSASIPGLTGHLRLYMYVLSALYARGWPPAALWGLTCMNPMWLTRLSKPTGCYPAFWLCNTCCSCLVKAAVGGCCSALGTRYHLLALSAPHSASIQPFTWQAMPSAFCIMHTMMISTIHFVLGSAASSRSFLGFVQVDYDAVVARPSLGMF